MKKYYCAKGLLAIISTLILSLMGSVSIAQAGMNISVSPNDIQYHESSTLTWTIGNASHVTITGDFGKIGTNVDSFISVSPGITTTYTIVGRDAGGNVVGPKSVTLTVTEAYLTVVSDDEIDLGSLGSVKPGDPFITAIENLLIGYSNMSSVSVNLSGTDLTREETNAEGQGTGSNDMLPTIYSYSIFYDRDLSNEINLTLGITAETKGPEDEGSSDAGVYEGLFTLTLSGSL